MLEQFQTLELTADGIDISLDHIGGDGDRLAFGDWRACNFSGRRCSTGNLRTAVVAWRTACCRSRGLDRSRRRKNMDGLPL